jgi:cyanobactin maturation PatA/PatG family protease
MYSWTTETLLEAVLGPAPKGEAEMAEFEPRRQGVYNFLERVYYELRNLGLSSQERAMNFAATNAFQIGQAFTSAAGEALELDSIEVERSPVCRPGSDCWDVKLGFFDPTRRMERARKVYRLTVDVSEPLPVTVGAVRSWSVY